MGSKVSLARANARRRFESGGITIMVIYWLLAKSDLSDMDSRLTENPGCSSTSHCAEQKAIESAFADVSAML